jgi:hypothetical protein
MFGVFAILVETQSLMQHHDTFELRDEQRSAQPASAKLCQPLASVHNPTMV